MLGLARAAQRAAFGIWLKVPFGPVCSITQGKRKVTLLKDLTVVIDDGKTKDSLPVFMVSIEIQLALGRRIHQLGYMTPGRHPVN